MQLHRILSPDAAKQHAQVALEHLDKQAKCIPVLGAADGFVLHFTNDEASVSHAFAYPGKHQFLPLFQEIARRRCRGCNAHTVNILVCRPNTPTIGWHQDHTFNLNKPGIIQAKVRPDFVTVTYLQMPQPSCADPFAASIQIKDHERVHTVRPEAGQAVEFAGHLLHRVLPYIQEGLRVSFVVEHYTIKCRDPAWMLAKHEIPSCYSPQSSR